MEIISQKGFSLIKFFKYLFIGIIILGISFFIAFKIYQKWEYAALEASASAYVEGASNAIITNMMSNTSLKLKNTCRVYKDNLNCPDANSLEQILLPTDIKGNLPISGFITFTDTGLAEKAELVMESSSDFKLLSRKHKVICEQTACHIK